MTEKLGLIKAIVLAAVTGLMLLLSYNTLITPPVLLLDAVSGETMQKQTDPIIWAIQLLPLAILLPGLIRGGHRSYAWLCFVVMIYFMAAVLNAFTPGYTWPPYVEIALTVTIFIAAMLYARYVRRKVVT
jgi:uncharacterized membrane protein